jgi:hypothetical protein
MRYLFFNRRVCRACLAQEPIGGHSCTAVTEAGLAGTENGELLSLAEQKRFDVFLTVDRGVQHQQYLASRKIAVVILRARKTSLPSLMPLVRSF